MKTKINAVQDAAVDFMEKCSTPCSRAGHAIERVGKLLEGGIAPNVIAMQMTTTSPTGIKYTRANILAFGDLYEDSISGQAMPAKQARALLADVEANSPTTASAQSRNNRLEIRRGVVSIQHESSSQE